MTMDASKYEVRTGLFHLKEIVLDVLLDARRKGKPLLQPKEIRDRLGIPPTKDEGISRSSLILGILYYLKDENRVQSKWEQGSDKWKITEQEALLRVE